VLPVFIRASSKETCPNNTVLSRISSDFRIDSRVLSSAGSAPPKDRESIKWQPEGTDGFISSVVARAALGGAEMKPFSCATPCQLASIPNGGTYDASRVTPVLERLCPCSLPARPFLLDVGTAAAESRPDIVNWLRGSSHQMWRVLGYDPKPSNCRSIKRVIDRADPMGNRSRFLCAAVSDRKGVFELAESEGAEGSQLKDDPAAFGQTWTDGAQTFKASGRTRVPVVTLDSEVPGDAAVWMLKADVQGHEMQVLRGAIKLLRERRVAWMVLELDVFALKAASAPGRPSSGSELLGFLERCATPSPCHAMPSLQPAMPCPQPATPSPQPATPSPQPVAPSPQPVAPSSAGTISAASTCARGRGDARGTTHARTSGTRATSTERARTLTCSAATAVSLCRLPAGERPSSASFAIKAAGEPTCAARRRDTDGHARRHHATPSPW